MTVHAAIQGFLLKNIKMKPISLYCIFAFLILPFVGLCQENDIQLCLDGIDNDGDGKVDCLAFSECANQLVYIPNAFSPRADGLNDLFYIYGGRGVKVVRFFGVYNHLGKEMFKATNFEPNDPRYGWDGSYRGVKKNPGVYLYLAKIEFIDGTVHQFSGDVLIFN